MRKMFSQVTVMFLVLFFVSGCKKETKNSIEENAINSSGSHGTTTESEGSCLLTGYDFLDITANQHFTDYYTYGKHQLLTTVIPWYGTRFTLEYNSHKKLINAKQYDGQALVYLISFTYANNKIIKETWIDASTNLLNDIYYLTYNSGGRLVQKVSYIDDLYTNYTYKTNGSLNSWKITYQGLPYAQAEYTYINNYSNPFLLLNGVDDNFWYTNSGFGKGVGAVWPSAEKDTKYTNSIPTVVFDQVASRTQWQIGQDHFPISVNYVDRLTENHFINTFGYSCNENDLLSGDGNARSNSFPTAVDGKSMKQENIPHLRIQK